MLLLFCHFYFWSSWSASLSYEPFFANYERTFIMTVVPLFKYQLFMRDPAVTITISFVLLKL